MSVNAASTLLKYLLDPAPFEHLHVGVTSEEHYKVHHREIILQGAACCAKLQRDTPLQQDGVNVQLLVNDGLADQLVIELGSHTKDTTQ